MARKGKRKGVKEEDLSPLIAKGLTQGVPMEEALSYFPIQSGEGSVSHMAKDTYQDHVPVAKFVAEEDTGSIWYEEATDRMQKNVTLTFSKEVVRALKSGMICLRCLEPQTEPFPLVGEHLPGCTYPIRERQIMDLAMEMVGDRHLGPDKPIREYLEEQSIRVEKRKFMQKVLQGGGGARKIPKAWLHGPDAAVLLDGLSDADRKVIGAAPNPSR